ncbi:MAG: protein jag [Ruminococcus sp.]|nr:protein jag [Ruminococcus sp.]
MVAEEEKKAAKPVKAPESAKPAPVPVAAEPVKPAEIVKEEPVYSFEADEEPAEAPAKPIDSKALAAKTEAAVNYIVSILEGMGLENVSAVPTEADGGIIIELNADGLNEMIGKKGELLDSLQYLSSLVCNRIDREYFRITTDSCGFRARRKAQLERLAHKLANNVKKSGRTHSLEPMNPYERRIIHAAVSEVEGVTSKSVGEEPYRKVVISSTEKKPRDFKGGKGNRRGGDRKGHYNKSKPHYDITTSFEKNYKKPKPEDDMDLGSGAYGKINF